MFSTALQFLEVFLTWHALSIERLPQAAFVWLLLPNKVVICYIGLARCSRAPRGACVSVERVKSGDNVKHHEQCC